MSHFEPKPIIATLEGMIEHEDEFLEQIGIQREPFDPGVVMERFARLQEYWDALGTILHHAAELPDDDPRQKDVELDAKNVFRLASDAMRSVVSMLGIKLLLTMLERNNVPEVTEIVLHLLVGDEYDVARIPGVNPNLPDYGKMDD